MSIVTEKMGVVSAKEMNDAFAEHASIVEIGYRIKESLMSNRVVSIHEQITCVKREIETRISSYPRKIDRKTMHKNVADYEIECMQSVLKTLDRIAVESEAKVTK